MTKTDRHPAGGRAATSDVPSSWAGDSWVGGAESGVRAPRLAGRYKIGALVGSGSMGSVYRAHDVELDEVVAVKILRPELACSESVVDLFRREVKLARRVAHPNVARVYDIGAVGETRFLTMEYVEGPSLAAVIERGSGLGMARVVDMAIAIASALGAAHEAQVVHRDLKPENVLLAQGGRVVVTDFGIARALDPGVVPDGLDAQPVGSPAYMAPEQVLGQTVDPRSDLYSLGVVVFEALTGVLPFAGKSRFALAAERLGGCIPDVRKLRPATPPRLAALVERCLERAPTRRHASSAEVIAELRVVAAELVDPRDAAFDSSRAARLSAAPLHSTSSAPPSSPSSSSSSRRSEGRISRPPESQRELAELTAKTEHPFRDGLAFGHARASELYGEIARRAPNDADHLARHAIASLWHWFFGTFTHDQGDAPRAAAEKAIERALSIDPDHLDARYARALLLSFLGRAREATQETLRALDLGETAALHELLGRLLREAGAASDARRALERAIALDGEALVASLELGRLGLLEGDGAEAKRCFDRVVSPRDPRSLPGRLRFAARMALWHGSFDEARDIAASGDPTLCGLDHAYRLLQASDPKPELQKLFDDADSGHGCVRAVASIRQFEAEIACALGDLEWAMLAIARSIEAGFVDSMWLTHCPVVAFVRRDARSQGLVRVLDARAAEVRAALLEHALTKASHPPLVSPDQDTLP